MALLVLCVRPPRGDGPRAAWLAAFLAVLTAAIRVQYAPLALALLGLWFLRAGKAARLHAVAAAIAFFLAVGAFDAVTWDGEWFHSYRTYLEFNLAIDRQAVVRIWPRYQYLAWLLFLGGGLSALCTAAALLDLRRYGFLLVLLSLILVPHSIEEHKEYRFVFVVGPLWLLIGAGVIARLASRARRRAHPPDASSGRTGPAWIYATAGALFAAVSLAGALNQLPRWDEALTEGISADVRHPVRFLHSQDPAFAAYRWLAAAPGVKAVWNLDRDYLDTPGYYYLHREIPFYDRQAGLANELHADLDTLRASVSHLVTVRPDLAVPGYVVEKEFGRVRILRREENEAPVRGWRGFNPTITHTLRGGLSCAACTRKRLPCRPTSISDSSSRSDGQNGETKEEAGKDAPGRAPFPRAEHRPRLGGGGARGAFGPGIVRTRVRPPAHGGGRPAASARPRRSAMEMVLAGARAGLCGACGHRPVRRFPAALRRIHAVP